MDIQKINQRVFAELGKERQLVEYHMIMYKLLGIVVDFINAEGESLKLSKMRHFNPFCALLRSTETGFAACQACDRANARSAALGHEVLVYRCHAGLTEIVAPLYDRAGNYIGCMTAGQFKLAADGDGDDGLVARAAEFHGVDAAALGECHRHSKVLSQTQVEGVVDYLKAVGAVITETHNKLLFLETVDAPDKIALIKRHVEENYMRRLTVAGVAKKFFLSPGHFCRLFKKEVGVSFICFVNMLRISKAEEMLVQTRRSISEVAFLSGFGSVSQFNRMFKAFKGVSALRFREGGGGH